MNQPTYFDLRDFLESVDAHPKPPPTFIPGRFPHTYAYDYVRGLSSCNLSRSEVAGLLSAFCEARGLDAEWAKYHFAVRFCDDEDIVIPRYVYDEFIAGK